MELGSGNHVSYAASATFNGDIVLVLRVVELLVILVPLGVGGITVVRISGLNLVIGVQTRTNPEVFQFVTGHHVVVHGEVRQGGDTILSTIGNSGFLVIGTGLGGHVHNTVGCTGTVDGGCRCILQNGDGQNVVRVHGHDGTAAGRNTVNHKQRGSAGSEGTYTVQGHGYVVITGNTTRCEHGQTGHLTLEHIQGRSGRGVRQGFGLHGFHGTYQVGNFLAGTITDNHRFFNEFAGNLHANIDGIAAIDGLDNIFVTYTGEYQRGVTGNRDGISTIRIGDCTVGCSLHHDGGSGKRTIIVGHLTGHFDVLCNCRKGHQHSHQ